MKILMIILAALMLSCDGSDPASSEDSAYNSNIHLLSNINLDEADTLALKNRVTPSPVSAGVPSQAPSEAGINDRCSELGKLEGVNYTELVTENNGNNQGSFTPCFKNIRFWQEGMIYGQYRPIDSSNDVWFITDDNGDVHHIPNGLKKDSGFKNDHLIRQYKGKPMYLNPEGILTSFNTDNDTEEIIINEQIGRFVVIPKDNGEHIAYHDLNGGKIRRPDDSIEEIPEVNTFKFYYRNSSNDLGYVSTMKFRNMIFDATGNILDRAKVSNPVAYQYWVDNLEVGSTPPQEALISGSIQACELSDNLMLCEFNLYVKGYIIPDSSQDIQEINWCSFGHCSGLTPTSCTNSEYIYYYSSNNNQAPSPPTRQLTQISRDLSGFEHLLTNIEVTALTCLEDGKLLIKGLNMDSEQQEVFHFDTFTKVKTMITEEITEFIN